MTPIPLTPETQALARRIIWFETPAEALGDPIRFIAYALERATHEDITVLRRYVTDDAIRETLAAAPLGIIGPRSWAYWHFSYSCLGSIPGDHRNPPQILGGRRKRRGEVT